MNWLLKFFKKKKHIPIKLTVKAVIRWEQLNNKQFSLLDNNSEDEVLSLFYVCALSDGVNISFDEFKENLKPTDAERMAKEFEHQTFIISQFQTITEKEEEKGKEKDSEDTTNIIYIKDIVPMLVMDGLDVYFAMNDMELCDLQIFLEAYDQKRKDKLTAQRLWTYKLLSPHLEEGTTPEDIHPFPWDSKEETLSEEELEEGKEESITFLKTGLKK